MNKELILVKNKIQRLKDKRALIDEKLEPLLYCFSSGSSNECEMNKKPPAMPVRLNGFSEKIPPMLR